jgi:hypothetical protein
MVNWGKLGQMFNLTWFVDCLSFENMEKIKRLILSCINEWKLQRWLSLRKLYFVASTEE